MNGTIESPHLPYPAAWMVREATQPHPPVALFVFGLNARRIGGIECHARETAVRLGERGWRAVLCFHQQPSPEVREYLSLPNVVWEELPKTAINSWRTSWNLARMLWRYQPALLHFQLTPFLGLNAWIAYLSGVEKIVFTDHTSHHEGFRPRVAPAWRRVLGKFLNHPVAEVITVSDFNRNVMATLGTCPPSRLRTIYNGADLAVPVASDEAAGLRFRAAHGIPAERILITQVSSLIPEKGIPEVLEAFRLALGREPELHLAFVGDGKCAAEYARLSAQMGLDGHVSWLGLLKNPMAEGVYAATDISCQASRWQEAFGLVIAEAMVFGKPVVGTRVGGIPEVVEDGKTGLLVPPGDTAALADAFVLLARNPEIRSRMGLAGLERARNRFDVRKNVSALLEVYGIR